MTGFARSDVQAGNGLLVWELRSVNHRYLELQVRVPEELRGIEPQVRERVGAVVKRGKVECSLRFETVAVATVTVNERLAAALLAAAVRLPAGLAPLAVIDVLRWPGVVGAAPAPPGPILEPAALSLLNTAIATFQEQRLREGTRMGALLADRVVVVQERVGAARALVPELVPEFRRRLHTRLQELGVSADPARLEQELALLAQRADITEELDRLEAHADEVARLLQAEEPLGRRLDFMMQELNREANTLGSKATDLRLTTIAVDLKVTIEQMREQIQNLE